MSKSCRTFFKKNADEFLIALFLFFRFIFKSYLNGEILFTDGAILSNAPLLKKTLGFTFVIIISTLCGVIIGGIIKKSGGKRKEAAILFALVILACPVSFPFLYKSYLISFIDIIAFLLFITSVFVVDKPVIKWIAFIVVGIFSFSFCVSSVDEWLYRLSSLSYLYVPVIMVDLSLYAFRQNILGKKVKSAGLTENKILFYACAVVAVSGLISRHFSTCPPYVNDSVQTIIGCILIVIPVVVFLFVLDVYIFSKIKNESRQLYITVVCIILVVICVVNRINFSMQCLPMLVFSLFLIDGFTLKNAGAEYDSAFIAFADFFKSKPILTIVMLVYMSALTAATTGMTPEWFPDLIIY